jgi:hypothetical protein
MHYLPSVYMDGTEAEMTEDEIQATFKAVDEFNEKVQATGAWCRRPAPGRDGHRRAGPGWRRAHHRRPLATTTNAAAVAFLEARRRAVAGGGQRT